MLTFLYILIFIPAKSQTIDGYEYWFDQDFGNRQTTLVSPVAVLDLNLNVPTATLAAGVHAINFRSFDSNGLFSSIVSKFFYKSPSTSAVSNSLVTYEYWYDNNYANATTISIANLQSLSVNSLLSTSGLNTGAHIFNIRFKDEVGTWSSTVSQFFYKIPEASSSSPTNLVSCQYWFDGDYAGNQQVSLTNNQQIDYAALISTDNLVSGIHILNVRFKDSNGLYSSTVSQFFYKIPPQVSNTPNQMVAYRYWYENDFANAINITLTTPVEQFSLIDQLDFRQIPNGNYVLNFQFKDQWGQWSVVSSNTIEKVSLPIADFAMSKVENCDSTVVTFTNLSVDSDTYLWDFGDGQSSTAFEPNHTFYSPGAYQVSLLSTEGSSGKDSLKTVNITVKGPSTATISRVSCGPYTSPSGKYNWVSSGVYNDTLTNSSGCDSVLLINLTVNPVIIPTAPVASSNYRCGPGSVSLSASGCTSTYNWFATNSGGEPLATTSVFNTPILNANTTYYVACNQGECLSNRAAALATVHISISQEAGNLAPGNYAAYSTITSRATVGNPTTFKAGGSILLEPGFKVETGTVFKAEIGPCPL